MRKTTHPGAHAAGKRRLAPQHTVKLTRPARRQLPPEERKKRRWFLLGTAAALVLLAVLAALQLHYTRPDTYAERPEIMRPRCGRCAKPRPNRRARNVCC